MIKNLYSLQFEIEDDLDKNLNKLQNLIKKCKDSSLIVASEVCTSGFLYNRLDEISEFNKNIAYKSLKELSENKIIVATFIEKIEDSFYNMANVFYRGEIVKRRSKYRLFKLTDEDRFFSKGSEDIEIFEIDGVKIAILICFEIRFIEYWKKLQGVDIVVVCAYWGRSRAEHFKTLTNAISISNQCYVVASDSKNSNATKQSGIIKPNGEELRDEKKDILHLNYDPKEIEKMRRYINIGIK